MNYTKPQLSVIIPTINREKYLFNTIKDLNNQLLKNIEVIIIDQNKKINFTFYKNLEKKFKKLKIVLFYQNIINSSAARNLGVKNARSNIVLFLDDDVKILSRFFLKNHLRNYTHKDVQIVAGKILEEGSNSNKKNFLSKCKSFFFKNDWRLFRLDSSLKVRKYKIGRSANLSTRKKTYLKLGGMDTNFIKGAHREETDFLFNAAHKKIKVLFDPCSQVIHLKATTGGIRNFNKFEKAFLELYGEIYFNLKHIFNINILFTLLIIFRKYFFSKLIILKPYLFILNLIIFTSSFMFALKKLFFSNKKIFKTKKIL
tara:strand:+ start:43619 stop:44560 length:942 start_codon:yes stop_codon:yes gene_type:complete